MPLSRSWLRNKGTVAVLICALGAAAWSLAPATATGGEHTGDRVKVSVRVACSLGVDRDGKATSNCRMIQIGRPEDGMVSYMVLEDSRE